eukprot:g1720.t1
MVWPDGAVAKLAPQKQTSSTDIFLTSEMTCFGCSQTSDVVLPALCLAGHRHAIIRVFDGCKKKKWRQRKTPRSLVMDLGSPHGTFVNGKRVKEQSCIRNGDTITFGPVNAGGCAFIFYLADDDKDSLNGEYLKGESSKERVVVKSSSGPSKAKRRRRRSSTTEVVKNILASVLPFPGVDTTETNKCSVEEETAIIPASSNRFKEKGGIITVFSQEEEERSSTPKSRSRRTSLSSLRSSLGDTLDAFIEWGRNSMRSSSGRELQSQIEKATKSKEINKMGNQEKDAKNVQAETWSNISKRNQFGGRLKRNRHQKDYDRSMIASRKQRRSSLGGFFQQLFLEKDEAGEGDTMLWKDKPLSEEEKASIRRFDVVNEFISSNGDEANVVYKEDRVEKKG